MNKIYESLLLCSAKTRRLFRGYLNGAPKNEGFIELTDQIAENLKQRPRRNDVLIPLLKNLVEIDAESWIGNIELAESYAQISEWGNASIYASVALKARPGSIRAKTLLSKSYMGLNQPSSALDVMVDVFCTKKALDEAVLDEETKGKLKFPLYKLFIVLSQSGGAWVNKAHLIYILRDVLIALLKYSPPNLKLIHEIQAAIHPGSCLSVVESIRLLQLKSIVVGSHQDLVLWLNARQDSFSAEEAFIAYLLIARLGDFPERFKAFLNGQEEIAQFLLDVAVNKIKVNSLVPQRSPSKGQFVRRYLFLLASMPHDGWFLRTGAHFKVVVDYARYLTEIDQSAEVVILFTNELSDQGGVTHFGRWPNCSDSEIFTRGFDLHHPGYDKRRIRFECVQPSLGESNDDYFSIALKKISSIDPDVIIWFGGVLESIIFPKVIGDKYPSVFRQFNVGNRPRGHFDIGMSYSDKTPVKFGGNWIKFGVAYSDLPTHAELPGEIDRVLVDNSTVLLTAGSDLIRRIDDRFVGFVKDVLTTDKASQWILVGIKDFEAFFVRFPALEEFRGQGRLICCGFVEYLGKLLDRTNIFVYPKQGGGSGGMALAAMRGIPVLCFSGGDTDAIFQKEDMVSNYDDFGVMLKKLLAEKDYRDLLGNRYKDICSDAKFIAEAKQLSEASKAALEIFTERNKTQEAVGD